MKRLIILLFFVPIAIGITACKKEYVPENKIQDDVAFLADYKLEGRQTGTEGEKAAAEYIVHRFTELGLEPKGTKVIGNTLLLNQKRGLIKKSNIPMRRLTVQLPEEMF